MKNIIGICGSASRNSSNLALLYLIANKLSSSFNVEIIEDLAEYPQFRTEFTDNNVPEKIVQFRSKIMNADGIIICTPEYVFSIPSGLKNILEWCVSTTVFSEKPSGLITASSSGVKGHEELKLIMKTIQSHFTEDTTLLISGIKGKIDKEGNITDNETLINVNEFIEAFKHLSI